MNKIRRNMTTTCTITTILIYFLATGVVAQDSKISPAANGGFERVTIGTQQWMAENLNARAFRNDDPIPEARTEAQWEAAYQNEKAAWSYYNNDPSNGEKYGRLYNWYAVNDKRGVCPKGWHVPTDNEWSILTSYLGGENVAGVKMKSSTGWSYNGNGNNNSGFNALPGGHRYYKDAGFYHIGNVGFWWSSTKNDKWNAWYRALHVSYNLTKRDNGGMNTGFSVRCLKD